MSERNIVALEEKAKEILKLVEELNELAEANDFGVDFSESQINFSDWLSSDCYGEGNSEEFGVGADGNVWHASSC